MVNASKISIFLIFLTLTDAVAGNSASEPGVLTSKKTAVQSSRCAQEKTRVPFEFFDNRILVDVVVDDSGPLKFIFDTGGSNILDSGAAAKLKITTKEDKAISGAGDQKSSSQALRVREFSVGGFALIDQPFLALDLSGIKRTLGFKKLDGVFGYEVLQRMGAYIDFEERTLEFADPSCLRKYLKDAVMIPFELQDEKPVVAGTVEGVPGRILLDTGDRSAFTLFEEFAKKSKLESIFAGKPEIISGYGVGGPIPARISSLSEISIDDKITLNAVPTRLPATTGGIFAKSELSGSLGNEVLRRFNIVFNYQEKEVAFIKNKNFASPYWFTPLDSKSIQSR